MIIIEGCDNTGKSTLLKQLCARIPELVYIPHGVRPPVSYDDYFKEMRNVLNRSDVGNVIVDRFLFSEIVYGPILRGKVGLDLGQMNLLTAKMQEDVKPFVIICYNPLSQIRATFEEREQLEGVVDNIEKIQEKFFSLFKGKNSYYYLDHTFYNWQEGLTHPEYGLDALVVRVKSYLKRRKEDECK